MIQLVPFCCGGAVVMTITLMQTVRVKYFKGDKENPPQWATEIFIWGTHLQATALRKSLEKDKKN